MTGPRCRPESSGDVTQNSAVVWSRTDRRARLVVDLTSHGRFDRAIRLRGPVTGPDDDYTAQLPLKGLRPGQRYDYRIAFEDAHGRRGETLEGSFSTPGRNRPVSFVWTGDTAGQGYGINPELGGMIAYKAMHETRPDFFLHSGDNIYADGPIAAEMKLADGTIWKNVVTEEVSKVAETLAEFRGRYKYNLLDDNVRGLYAEVPLVAQWDDHETLNNWYPGEILDDDRYTEKRVDVLAARAQKAFLEYLPMPHPDGPRPDLPQVELRPAARRLLPRQADLPRRQPDAATPAARPRSSAPSRPPGWSARWPRRRRPGR